MMQRMQRWHEIAVEFMHVTDARGCNIDPGIFETVVALNALGIHTSASCEGHLDHGIAAPWIDIENLQAYPFARMANQHMYKSQQGPPLVRQVILAEAEQKRLTAKRLHTLERQKLVPYLDRFYARRSTSYEDRLTINQAEWCGTLRLESQGADCQDVLTEEERSQKLIAYQREMHLFQLFLQGEYFKEKRIPLNTQ